MPDKDRIKDTYHRKDDNDYEERNETAIARDGRKAKEANERK